MNIKTTVIGYATASSSQICAEFSEQPSAYIVFYSEEGRGQKNRSKLSRYGRNAKDGNGRNFVMSVGPSVSPNSETRLLPGRFS